MNWPCTATVSYTHLGWVHVKDLLKLVGRENPDLRSVRRELRVVPDTMPLDLSLIHI